MTILSEVKPAHCGNESYPRMSLVTEQRQGNVFDFVQGPGPRLTIVFGHIGYSAMASSWRDFQTTVPGLKDIKDPFGGVESPLQLDPSTWIWFVPAGSNHGLTDADLLAKLDFILDWAKTKRIRFVVTNGIRDVDHGMDGAANRASDDRRTAMLTSYMARRERADRLKVELVSLNDVFVRYWVT